MRSQSSIKAIIKDQQFKIAVVGSGYVGTSLAVLLAQHDEVTVLDIDPARVAKVNVGETMVAVPEITAFLTDKELNLSATGEASEAYQGADFVVVAIVDEKRFAVPVLMLLAAVAVKNISIESKKS
jgi:UDP-glucose 6-dehydrogenase